MADDSVKDHRSLPPELSTKIHAFRDLVRRRKIVEILTGAALALTSSYLLVFILDRVHDLREQALPRAEVVDQHPVARAHRRRDVTQAPIAEALALQVGDDGGEEVLTGHGHQCTVWYITCTTWYILAPVRAERVVP